MPRALASSSSPLLILRVDGEIKVIRMIATYRLGDKRMANATETLPAFATDGMRALAATKL